MKSGILFSFFSLIIICNAFAQEIISNTGGHFNAGGIQISWTIGEPVIETCEGGNFCLTQGFHQSILTVTAINAIPEFLVDIMVYPNPVTTKINLSVKSEDLKNWTYSLYNSEGKLLESKNINSGIMEIPMQMYVASNYLLQVKENNRELKSFKIIKSR